MLEGLKLLRRLGLVRRLDEAGNFSVHHPPWPPVELGRHDWHRLAGVILPVLLLQFFCKKQKGESVTLPSELNEAHSPISRNASNKFDDSQCNHNRSSAHAMSRRILAPNAAKSCEGAGRLASFNYHTGSRCARHHATRAGRRSAAAGAVSRASIPPST